MPRAARCAHAGLVAALVLAAVPADGAVQFVFTPEAGTPQEAIDGFEAAGQLWADLLDDDIVVRVDIAFKPLDPGVLGSTLSERAVVTYQQLVTALGAQPASADDQSATVALQPPPARRFLLNRTSNSPHGSGNATPFLDDDGDANNTAIRMTRANAKALGLVPASDAALDAAISFSSDFNWDFEPGDGIAANHFNFVFVAAHEIGHMLGFTSGVDILDGNSPPSGSTFPDTAFTWATTADVFRYSAASLAEAAGVADWCADNRPKYFSLNGGATDLGEFSRGRRQGDGQQASHWRDNLGLGLMDPTTAPGEVLQITELDLRLFDTIGYERGAAAPPVVITDADLAIEVTSDVEVSFTVVARNLGPQAAADAVVATSFPPSMVDVVWQCTASAGATCTASGTGHLNDVVDLQPGAFATYVATGRLVGVAAGVSVTPAAGTNDPNPGNNTGGPGTS
jgi:hypothetical protein